MGLLLVVLAQIASGQAVPAAPAAAPRTMPELQAGIKAIPVPRGNPANWVNLNEYPPEAAMMGLEGKVDFTLQVDVSGKAVTCEITGTSGFEVLDKATCGAVERRARFNALPYGTTEPALRTYKSSVRWVVPRASERPENQFTDFRYTIDRAGIPRNCRLARSGMKDPPQTGEIGTCDGSMRFTPPTDGQGRPIALEVHARYVVEVRQVPPAQ